MENNPNILAERYASAEIKNIWSLPNRIRLEREFWISILRAQRELGLDIPQEAIDAYEREKDNVDIASIERRERTTKHDVKARIEEFCERAGAQHIHKGLTSRDLTENIEQFQIFKSLALLYEKSIAALSRFAKLADKHRDVALTARTHNVPAQLTTLGKRFAMWGEEFLHAVKGLEFILNNFCFRGIKGAVGTQLDQRQLFNADGRKENILEEKVLKSLGVPCNLCNAVGQVYPRSYDFEVISKLFQMASAVNNFAITLRLMAGQGLCSEGFAKGQVGSSAMPHKVNARSCERIQSFHTLLKGMLSIAADLAGNQWNEGDVSCSAARRVLFPDAIYIMDGLLETAIVVLDQVEFFKDSIEMELMQNLPFLLSTQFLMEAVKKGAGRESAHEAIKEHFISAVASARKGNFNKDKLLELMSEDKRIGLDLKTLNNILAQGKDKVGNAEVQVDYFIESAQPYLKKVPKAAEYTPVGIL